MIEWQTGEFPAQIGGFLDLTELREGVLVQLSNGTSVQKGVWAVVESCFYVDNDEVGARQSELFTPIILETNEDNRPGKRKFYLVDVETFKRPLVVIPNVGTEREYLMMTPRAQWGPDFVKWIMAPHTIDEAEMRDNPAPELQQQTQAKKKKAPKRKQQESIARQEDSSDSEPGTDSGASSS